MKVKFSKNSVKFLNSLSDKERERIRHKLKELVSAIEVSGLIPFRELDIKNLKGDWKGFLRFRIGKIRLIFKINIEDDELMVYEIDYRGGVYK
ncbi:type II toxin-antitoxin system RelE family toxin [Planktothrix agardhii]|jgi:mRNA interferase RelE/StbE|uniref:type II toxin-antitoxin system RelE family toxin n=1 Tax=Planktothrix agardhii TaxID=1160 RepID=UPI0020A83433|nr:hypothetical protein [Planktothrix agardhii]CAD5958050.1 hypothetical protein NO108_03354 [Planktothrix rubescens]CAD5972425.1 hypothetical protein NO365_03900 [Planktothrix agardhii]